MRSTRRDTNVSTALRSRPLALAAAALAVSLFAATNVHAQPTGAEAPAAKPVDTAKPAPMLAGKPDFTGVWDRQNPLPQPNAQRATGGSAQSPNGPQFAGQAPPIKPEFKAAYDAEVKRLADAEKRGEPDTSQNTMCLPQGMPAMMLAIFPMEVVQTPKQVTIIEEAFTQIRRLYIGEDPPKVEDAEPGFYGHTGAKWDGDTLVAETVGLKTNVLYRNVPHSENLRIHERLKMLDADHFEDEITYVDPQYLTGPWTWKWTYQRRNGYKMLEYVCEDNREFADPVTGQQRMRFKTKPANKQ
jgi:hypothetical protein